jgi:hypothetical protein
VDAGPPPDGAGDLVAGPGGVGDGRGERRQLVGGRRRAVDGVQRAVGVAEPLAEAIVQVGGAAVAAVAVPQGGPQAVGTDPGPTPLVAEQVSPAVGTLPGGLVVGAEDDDAGARRHDASGAAAERAEMGGEGVAGHDDRARGHVPVQVRGQLRGALQQPRHSGQADRDALGETVPDRRHQRADPGGQRGRVDPPRRPGHRPAIVGPPVPAVDDRAHPDAGATDVDTDVRLSGHCGRPGR